MNVRRSIVRLTALTVVAAMPLMGMSGIASAKTAKATAKCAAHPNKKKCQKAAGGGSTGTGGASGQCYVYDGCPADGQVEVCTFTGMPHCWAGGTDPGSGGTYSCTDYSSATQLQWDFFKKYAW